MLRSARSWEEGDDSKKIVVMGHRQPGVLLLRETPIGPEAFELVRGRFETSELGDPR